MCARVWRALAVLTLLAIGTLHCDEAAADARSEGLPGLMSLMPPSQEHAGPAMSVLPRTAQARCPGGQLVFLSRACGCNGACCLCSRQAPYLNHCTCRCEAAPTPCPQGHSAGRP
jgi:hypothetical protein